MSLRLGFIGLGFIARVHWEHLATRDDVELAAFCDIDESRLHPPALQYGAEAYVDYREMLDKARLDAVYICVPPYVDGPLELDCLSAGLPIFVEKPVAMSMTTARQVEAEIARRSAICAVGYHWRYMTATDRAREILGDAPIGFLQGRWVGGMPGAPWWIHLAESGGQMHEQGTHIVDLARWFGGEVEQVTAAGARTIMHDKVVGHDIWDSQAATLTFAGGAMAAIHVSHIAEAAPDWGLKLYAPEIAIDIREAPWSCRLAVHRKGQVETFDGPELGWREPRNIEDDAFIDAVLSGDASKIRSPYSDAVKSLAVTLAINAACETGQTIRPADMG